MDEFLLPVPVVYILKTLKSKGYVAYVVGGAVRDSLLKREGVKDWDITTNAVPEEVMALLPESVCNNAFGTVMWAPAHAAETMGKKGEGWERWDVFDITTFRSEAEYSDKRRPDKVSWGTSLEEDLKRRDFTINALALELDEEVEIESDEWVRVKAKVVDQYGGVDDLERKLVRTVGEANERFGEDALRMLRAIRFGAELGFGVDPETLAAIKRNAGLLAHISAERIRDELLKILGSKFPADGIVLLKNSGLLELVLPEMLTTEGVQQGGHHIYDVWVHSVESLRNCPSSDPIVRMATLLHDVGKPATARAQGPRGVTFYGHEVVGARMVKAIAERLKLSSKQKEKLVTLVRCHMFVYQPEMTDGAIRRFIRRVGVENINDMMMLRIGDRQGGGSKATSWRLRELQKRIGENLYEPLGLKDLKINGNDLISELNLKPGPVFSSVLNQLFEEVMEDKLDNEREVLLERAKELVEARV